ncbi:hypothetical protein BJX61DRAFT_502717 [Aspergillus egyptiacus]|nr:hypothetical protein BJX61DRAFT_502717 [Aspergillus egyptiacus]
MDWTMSAVLLRKMRRNRLYPILQNKGEQEKGAALSGLELRAIHNACDPRYSGEKHQDYLATSDAEACRAKATPGTMVPKIVDQGDNKCCNDCKDRSQPFCQSLGLKV